ncbi:cx9C motif-containing protein 4 isoform X1 [Lutra lutra]|uniref:cx9C motif-containing protein 4 isoform X1 n=1 Tax=Lutra lutra TaxID=9657 RepID=UPI001FD31CE3|nr:cx9C motif-containing protein 4 isoform X1 [Lutra lutra]
MIDLSSGQAYWSVASAPLACNWFTIFKMSFLDMPQKDPCQKQACEIQKCLQANNYMESKCQAVIQELRKCCARYPKGRSLVCSGFEREEEEKLTLKPTSK